MNKVWENEKEAACQAESLHGNGNTGGYSCANLARRSCALQITSQNQNKRYEYLYSSWNTVIYKK